MSPSSAEATELDLAALKAQQQAIWSCGDFALVAARNILPAEELCEAAGLQAGWRVLDVATGSGNAALAAARRGCEVVGADFMPAFLERGRARAEVEQLPVQFVEGDCERLPFPDASFHAVLSVFGAMFASDHAKAAAELVRVCRPGGVIALASWTPDGFVGDRFRLLPKYLPLIAGVRPPIAWGREAYVRSLFGGAIQSISSRVRTTIMRFVSAEANVDFSRAYYGPTIKLFEAVAPSHHDRLAKDLASLARRYDRNGDDGGPVAIGADYLESIIVRA